MNPDSIESKQPTRLTAWALIFLLSLIAFWPLVLSPTRVLYSDHSDMLAMHIPMKHFLVSSFQETGQIPNWCPSSFAGLPFVHDVQLAAFYPLHAPLYLLEPDNVGAAVSWLTVLHVMIAGWGMFCYGRCTSLSWHGSVAAAGVWMFAGKWMMHVIDGGHSILAPLAWLPWVLCCLQHATASRLNRHRVAWSIASGLLFGMMALGTHPQILFYSGIGIGLSLVLAVSTDKATSGKSKRFVTTFACGLLCAAIAVGVGAIQLLPAIEATPETTRAGGVSASDILPGGVRVLMNFFGPAIVATNASGGLGGSRRICATDCDLGNRRGSRSRGKLTDKTTSMVRRGFDRVCDGNGTTLSMDARISPVSSGNSHGFDRRIADGLVGWCRG